MSKQQEVKIQKGDLVGTVLASSVATWKRNGWTVVDDGSSDVEVKLPAPKVAQKKPEYPATDKTEEN